MSQECKRYAVPERRPAQRISVFITAFRRLQEQDSWRKRKSRTPEGTGELRRPPACWLDLAEDAKKTVVTDYRRESQKRNQRRKIPDKAKVHGGP
jgi:hypothetical protein